ncbi:unnamed protein product [Coregonus sp. 'balchen']|nr:unnamed protein product [Coregonus sp. 'balchen']
MASKTTEKGQRPVTMSHLTKQPATAKWYDRRDSVFIEFLVEDSKDLQESKHKRTDRSVLCCLKKAKAGIAWPRLTKDKAKFQWLGVDFNNWKDWEDDSDEDLSSFDKFSEASKASMSCCTKCMMNTMGGEDGMPDLGMGGMEGLEEHDSDDEKMPDLE